LAELFVVVRVGAIGTAVQYVDKTLAIVRITGWCRCLRP